MTETRSRLTAALAAGLSLALAACSGPGGGGAASGTPIGVGVIAPFSGPSIQFSHLLDAPCVVGTSLVNKAGGVMGHNLNCVSIDDTGDQADAVPNVSKAIATTQNLDMAIGLETLTAATTVPLLNQAKIPFFTADGLDQFNNTTDQYFWRATAPDSANGVAFGIWAHQQGYQKAAVILQSGADNEGNRPGIVAAIKGLGMTETIDVTIPGESASYNSSAERVIATQPDVLLFSADSQTSATFFANYQQLNNGVLPPTVMATDALVPDFYNAVTKAVGTQWLTTKVWEVGSYFDDSSAAFKTYADTMRSNPQTKASASDILGVGPPASCYDGLNIMALAMMEAKSTTPSAYNSYIPKVVAAKPGATVVHNYADGKAALDAGKTIQYVGVVGAVSFNQYHNFAGDFSSNQFQNGGGSIKVGVIPGSKVMPYIGS